MGLSLERCDILERRCRELRQRFRSEAVCAAGLQRAWLTEQQNLVRHRHAFEAVRSRLVEECCRGTNGEPRVLLQNVAQLRKHLECARATAGRAQERLEALERQAGAAASRAQLLRARAERLGEVLQTARRDSFIRQEVSRAELESEAGRPAPFGQLELTAADGVGAGAAAAAQDAGEYRCEACTQSVWTTGVPAERPAGCDCAGLQFIGPAGLAAPVCPDLTCAAGQGAGTLQQEGDAGKRFAADGEQSDNLYSGRERLRSMLEYMREQVEKLCAWQNGRQAGVALTWQTQGGGHVALSVVEENRAGLSVRILPMQDHIRADLRSARGEIEVALQDAGVPLRELVIGAGRQG